MASITWIYIARDEHKHTYIANGKIEVIIMKKLMRSVFKKLHKYLSGRGLGNLYPIRIIERFMGEYLRTDTVEILGHYMFLDSLDTLGLSIRPVYDPLSTKIVVREIKMGNVVVDIGAHIGYYTLLFARLVGDRGKVYAFEPEPSNFNLLKQNIEINGYKNVALIQKAVSNENGITRLYLSEINTGAATIIGTENDSQYIEIETTTLDDFLMNSEEEIDFIKIDIEGAESRAIEGMTSLLSRCEDLNIITEFNPILIEKSGIEPKEYLNLLSSYGFTFYDIDELHNKLEPTNISGILQKYCYEKKGFTNLLCLKNPQILHS